MLAFFFFFSLLLFFLFLQWVFWVPQSAVNAIVFKPLWYIAGVASWGVWHAPGSTQRAIT